MLLTRTSAGPDRQPATLPRVAYAAVFTLALPVLLIIWGARLDVWMHLPVLEAHVAGLVLTAAGVVLQLAAARDLWVHGGGLPASPFPPVRLVERGAYRFIAHPIYVGAVLTAFGVSLAAQSPGGFWVVSPALALAATAFVLGFERDATMRRYGTGPKPLVRLPDDSHATRSLRDVLAVYVLVFLPWLLLYQAVEFLGVPQDATPAYLPWEHVLPVVPWTEAIYAATYPFVLAAPFIPTRRCDLRDFAVRALWATAIVIPLYLLVPLIAPPRLVSGEGFWAVLMRLERAFDQPVTAFPAFHVVWTFLAARHWTRAYPKLGMLWWVFASAVAISCVTTGMHAVVDVVAGFVVYAGVVRGSTIWRALLGAAERVANAWGERTFGPVRLLGHGLYAAAGAMAGVTIAIYLAGRDAAGWIVVMTLAAVAGAGLWGQLVEGSPRLLRPYGYFGSVLGVVLCTLAAMTTGADGWLLFTAFGVGGTYAQAIGRLRCLSQGCCHGRETIPSRGIRYQHPRSRVVRIAGLRGAPLHPTPLYSAIWMLVVGTVLMRLWTLAAPVEFIAGLYFVLTGLGRFVEEHYRGEPQTAVFGGLRLYQWLAIGFIVGGASLTTFGASPAPRPQPIDLTILPTLALVGLATYAAYGVDFPRSDRRFSRLV